MSCLGVRNKAIAQYYKLKPFIVSNIIRRERCASKTIVKKKGRKQKLSSRSMRLFHKYVVQFRFEPLYVIVSKFSASTGIHISESTGRRYLRKLRIYCYVAIQKLFQSKRSISNRIQWALIHNDWKQPEWSNVMFTDESCFSVRPKKNRLYVCRYKGQKYLQQHIIPSFKSGYQTESVWGGFSCNGRTPLFGTIGSFDQNTYRIIVDNQIVSFVYDVHGGTDTLVLQENNCDPHRAKSIATYFLNEEVTRMKWPAQSPDLNPIENV